MKHIESTVRSKLLAEYSVRRSEWVRNMIDTDPPLTSACNYTKQWRHRLDLWRHHGDDALLFSIVGLNFRDRGLKDNSIEELNGERVGESVMALRSIVLEI